MAVMPDVEYRPISYAGVPRMSRYDVVCIHTIVGHDPAPAAHFSSGADGKITQSRDTAYQSAANYNGNPRVIAIENEDLGTEFGAWNTNDGHAVPSFTPAQCEAIAQICAWASKTHGIPLTLLPDSKPGSRGIGYHRQGIDGNWAGFAYGGRVAGGEVWTKTAGKVCPGDRRISQLINTIIPRARVLAGLEEGPLMDMNNPNDNALAFRVEALVNAAETTSDAARKHEPLPLVTLVLAACWRLDALAGGFDTIRDGPNKGEPMDVVRRLKVVEEKLGSQAPGGPVDYDALIAAQIRNPDYFKALAAANADEQDRRVRDGNPTTGPTT